MRNGRWLVALAASVAVLLGALDLPGAAGAMAALMVVVLVGAPMLRVAWFARRWATRGDPRFAAVASAVLVLPLVGLAISVATG